MARETIKFSEHDILTPEGKLVEECAFASLEGEMTITDEEGYSGVAKINKIDDCLWIYSQCGKNKPYSAEVINVKTSIKESNPRSKDQAELRRQEFFLYDCSARRAYVSGGLKFFEKVLRYAVPGVKTRNVYKSCEDFLASLRQVKSVRMLVRDNLFASSEKLFSAPVDELGLGHPEQVLFDAKFCHVNVSSIFKSWVRDKFRNGCQTKAVASLIVAGDCEEGDRLIESTFNLSRLSSCVTITATKDEAGFFNPDTVLEQLLSKVR